MSGLSQTQVLGIALRSMGTAGAMAGFGAVLTRAGVLDKERKSFLAKLSAKFTIPCLLFTSILNCSQNYSANKCSNLSGILVGGWPMLLLPVLNVSVGLLLGWLITTAVETPPDFRRSVWCAVAFGNSTGLPLTLLAVIHSSFPKSAELGAVDPSAFLALYLIVMPILQWAVGGMLMGTTTGGKARHQRDSLASQDGYRLHNDHNDQGSSSDGNGSKLSKLESSGAAETSLVHQGEEHEEEEEASFVAQVIAVMSQPPVVATLVGVVIAMTSDTRFDIRSVVVDTHDRDDDASLEWLFNGMLKMAAAAVPINMLILGCNLSSFGWDTIWHAPWTINILVVGAKMVLMPMVGVITALALRQVLTLEPKVDASFYLVVMVVTATPTANTVAVMAELGGENKELLATTIFTQYLFAPVLLTISIAVFVSITQKTGERNGGGDDGGGGGGGGRGRMSLIDK